MGKTGLKHIIYSMFKYITFSLLLSIGIFSQAQAQSKKERIDSDTTFKKACTIYESLKKGAKFNFVAILFSNDKASAAKGGDLGWISSDKLAKEALKAVGKLGIDDFSTPIETADGFYIYKLLEKKEDKYKLQLIYLKK